MTSVYSGLSRAQLSFEYLHANSTSHEFLFGALAEIVDNSRDANAERLEIFTVPDRMLRGGTMLCFLDDGEGMDPVETANVITFGLSRKKSMDSTQIGQYGNGLKSASMRIANDLIVFTKKENTMTCLMLSRTFHEEEKIKQVIVPLPSFHVQNQSPICDSARKGKERHETEMNLILRYSPFHTRVEFFDQFKRISNSGTLVILYNLKLLDNGIAELDFRTDPHDIMVAGIDLTEDKSLMPESYSFRAYVALLYSEPRMKVYIQTKKVQANRLVYNLYKPRSYQYTSARFKARSKEEAKKAEAEYKIAKQKLIEAEGRARELENSILGTNMSRDDRTKLRNLQKTAEDIRDEAKKKEIISERKQKSLKEPKTLSFIFGIHLENRKCDGLFIYNCNRLIKMYDRVIPQSGGENYGGVVGIVNVPYLVLEPTNNKQDFTDAKEYRHLLKVLGEHMEHYWKDVERGRRGMSDFWEDFGYKSSAWDEMPSMDTKYLQRRARETKICLQCDTCLNWRILPFSSNNVGKVFPDNWVCSLNPDTSRNRCSISEEKLLLPEGKFSKVEKSREEKEMQYENTIKKLHDKINKSSQREVVTSSRAARSTMAEVAQRKSDPKGKRSAFPEERTPPAAKRKRINNNRVSTESNHDEDVVYDFNIDTGSRRSGATRSSPRSRGINKPNTDAGDSTNSAESNTAAMDEWWPELSDDELEAPTMIDVGSRVEVEVRNKWYIGTALRKTGSDLIIRLDKLPFAQHDKRMSSHSDKIRLAQMPPSGKELRVQQEMPSSSTASNIITKTEPYLETISERLKTCLQYFRPPHWNMTKQRMQVLSLDELVMFPLEEFFSQYEAGLRNLILEFQTKAEEKTAEAAKAHEVAENAKNKLKHTNRLIARLLNSIHDECNLDPDANSDKVDELLQACVAQAEMSSNQTDQVSTSCL